MCGQHDVQTSGALTCGWIWHHANLNFGLIRGRSMAIHIKIGQGEYRKILSFGAGNNLVLDRICAFLLALTPILQHYKGLVENAGITVLIAVLPWILFRSYRKIRSVRFSEIGIVLGLVLFTIYKTFIHGASVMNIAYCVVISLYFLAAASGGINIRYLIMTAGRIAILASVLVILQTMLYYLFHFHLQLVPTSLLLPESNQWVAGAQTGLIGINGVRGTLYRPSAFFLEPSHLFLFSFPLLFTMLFSQGRTRWKRNRAIILSIGMLMSTSGMGVLTVICAWLVFFALSSGKFNQFSVRNLLKAKNFIMVIAFIAIGLIVCVSVPVIRSSIMRFLDSSTSGAIAGRSRLATALIRTLGGKSLLTGVTNTLEGIEFNMPGFSATLYKSGIIGVVLSYTTYFCGLIKLRKQYFWISLLVILASFSSAQTHGTFYMFFYVFFILEGNYEQRICGRKAVMKKGKRLKLTATRARAI